MILRLLKAIGSTIWPARPRRTLRIEPTPEPNLVKITCDETGAETLVRTASKESLKRLELNTTRDGVRYYSCKVPSQEERVASLNRRRKLLGTPEVISEPGAAIEVTRIPLTEEGKERLSIPFDGKSLPSPKGKA